MTTAHSRSQPKQRASGVGLAALAGVSLVGGLAGREGVQWLRRWGLPADPLPATRGPHAVGTSTVVLDDDRRIPVQIWYPCQGGPVSVGGPGGMKREPAVLFPAGRGAASAIASGYPIPARLLQGLTRQRGHAVIDAEPITRPTGVVVISHGWLGFRAIHADLAEQLASDGWVVLAPDHIGGALLTQYPNGSVVGLEPDLMPREQDPAYPAATRRLVERFAADITSVIAAMSAGAMGEAVPVVDEVWLIGQSTGGGAAIASAAGLTRVAGIIGLDPWVEPLPPSTRADLTAPFIAIRSGQWAGNNNDGLLVPMAAEMHEVPEAGHIDLTGIGFLCPALRATPLLRCDPMLSHRATLNAFRELVGT